MFQSLKLDKENLLQFDYHWFWGLRYNKTPQSVNMWLEVDKLLQDEEKLKDLIENQTNLYLDHNAIVRLFYWIFNIDNYNYHAYLLTACRAYQNYLNNSLKKDISMIEKERMDWKFLASGLIAGVGYAAQRIHSYLSSATINLNKKNSDNESTKVLAKLQETIPTINRDVSSERAEKEVVIVTDLMQPHLKVLGIKQNTGTLLTLSEFKSICKAQYLASHPDKPGGTTTKPSQYCCLTSLVSSKFTRSVYLWKYNGRGV